MEKLLNEIEKIEIIIEPNFSYNLDREFELISLYLNGIEKELLERDKSQFIKIGRFIVLNTFGGGILFLKVSEIIEKIKIEYENKRNHLIASVIFESEIRKSENIKYKPDAGKIESIAWNIEGIFPNFPKYQKMIQCALILIIGKIVKKICEYGRTNFGYMKIENEFDIELVIDGQVESKLNVEISQKENNG